jgi:hypothetical protein
LFSRQDWGYLTRSKLELGILIIHGCSKKMVYQYAEVAKKEYPILADLEYRTRDLRFVSKMPLPLCY